MRTLALLASVLALTVVSGACTQETAAPTTTGSKAKKGKTSHPGSGNQAGEHGSAAPADDPNGDAPPPDEGTAIGTETWDNGKAIAANGTISAGATVTISPGATVTMADNVAITIKGTLKVAAGANHAHLTGTTWQGLIIAEGGVLDVDGLEIKGAKAGLWTQPGNGTSTFKNGVLDAATPFKMEAGSNLSVDHSKVIANGASAIAGKFTANYMDYDKGSGSGLVQNDPAGTMTFNNCTLHGAGGGDYVISNTGKNVTVTRTSISGSHCAFHFSGSGEGAGTSSFLIDGVDVRNNGVGGMLYNSGAGPNEVKNSNFVDNNEYDISFGSNANGTITFTNTFVTLPKEGTGQLAANVKEVNPATDKLPPTDVGPVAE